MKSTVTKYQAYVHSIKKIGDIYTPTITFKPIYQGTGMEIQEFEDPGEDAIKNIQGIYLYYLKERILMYFEYNTDSDNEKPGSTFSTMKAEYKRNSLATIQKYYMNEDGGIPMTCVKGYNELMGDLCDRFYDDNIHLVDRQFIKGMDKESHYLSLLELMEGETHKLSKDPAFWASLFSGVSVCDNNNKEHHRYLTQNVFELRTDTYFLNSFTWESKSKDLHWQG